MCDHLSMHGDGVKDVAFSVEDLDGIMRVCSVLVQTIYLFLCLIVCPAQNITIADNR